MYVQCSIYKQSLFLNATIHKILCLFQTSKSMQILILPTIQPVIDNVDMQYANVGIFIGHRTSFGTVPYSKWDERKF